MGVRRLDVAHVTWSVGEIGALSVKAVRGAGYSWGVAEEAGWAVRWLIRAGIDGSAVLANALDDEDIASLLEGISWADRGLIPNQLVPARSILALPFVSAMAPKDGTLIFGVGEQAWKLSKIGCSQPLPSDVLNYRGTGPAASFQTANRATTEPAVITRLSSLAATTYAPSTQASRLSGAGAGLTDND